MYLNGLDVTVWDLEIKESIGKNGIGWRDYDKMGVSVGCSFNFKSNEYKVFMDDNIEELHYQLEKSVLAVGFNTVGFDVPLLDATTKLNLNKENHYDMLIHSRAAHGGGSFVKGFKLDNHLQGTFGEAWLKTADGFMAPIWWQEKKLGKLISYCLDDVKREAKLFEFLWNTGTVKLDSHGELKIKTRPQEYFNNLKGKQLELI